LVWDFAHIGHFEELWLLRNVAGKQPLHSEHDDVYDAFAHARAERGELPFLPPAAARAFVNDVRDRALELLAVLEPNGDRLPGHGFVFGLVVQHELQHVETMAQTMQLGGLPAGAPRLPTVEASGEVLVPAGVVQLGADRDQPWAYDNELPAHEVDVAAFRIDRGLVTNADFAAFIGEGGYDDRALWTDEGWAWRGGGEAGAPPDLQAGCG